MLAVLATYQRFELVQFCIQGTTALQHGIVAGRHVATHHSGWGGLQAGQHQQADGLEAQGLSRVQGRGGYESRDTKGVSELVVITIARATVTKAFALHSWTSDSDPSYFRLCSISRVPTGDIKNLVVQYALTTAAYLCKLQRCCAVLLHHQASQVGRRLADQQVQQLQQQARQLLEAQAEVTGLLQGQPHSERP